MLLYRSKTGGRDIGLGVARLVTAGSLLAYPAGALVLKFGDPGVVTAVAGYGLILISLICVAVMMSSSVQRIVGEQPDKLDEYQLKLRSRAVSGAYASLSALALVAVIYAALAADRGAWVPKSYDEFNGLFWGVFLYASMLPSAFLVWQIDPADAAPEGTAR